MSSPQAQSDLESAMSPEPRRPRAAGGGASRSAGGGASRSAGDGASGGDGASPPPTTRHDGPLTGLSRAEAWILEILQRGRCVAQISLEGCGSATVGRSDAADVKVDDRLLSRCHFTVEWRVPDSPGSRPEVRIVDLKSKNHTCVNLEAIQEATLEPDDIVTFGDCRAYLRVRRVRKTGIELTDDEHHTRSELSVVDSNSVLGFDQLGRGGRELIEVFYGLTEQLLRHRSRADICSALQSGLLDVLSLDRFIVSLESSGESTLDEVAHAWSSGDEARVSMSRSILDAVRRQRQAVVVEVTADDRLDTASVRELGMRSYMVAPVVYDDEYLGFLYVDRVHEPVLDRDDLQFFQTVAHLAGIALNQQAGRDQLESDRDRLKQIFERRGGFVAESPVMTNVVRRVERVAPMTNPILLEGETGTGKEVLARMIHDLSDRSTGPFIAFNCALSSPELIESELFGHASGAFTGARSSRRGRFELASGGTLFLDEVGDMPLSTQVKLLRAIQEGEIWPVGAEEPVTVDIRIVSATHKNLSALRRTGEFRDDLYYRLSVLPICLPPLRKRGADIVRIAESLLPEAISFADPTIEALLAYGWPGNVRELRNVIEQALFNSNSSKIRRGDLPTHVSREGKRTRLEFEAKTLREVEEKHIRDTLDSVEGNKQRAAEQLGISRSTLYQKLRAYGI